MAKKKRKLNCYSLQMTYLYIERPKDKKKKKVCWNQSTISKVEEYKITTQKSVAFLYINNKTPEKEMKKTISFMIASKQ